MLRVQWRRARYPARIALQAEDARERCAPVRVHRTDANVRATCVPKKAGEENPSRRQNPEHERGERGQMAAQLVQSENRRIIPFVTKMTTPLIDGRRRLRRSIDTRGSRRCMSMRGSSGRR
jgi:hypothetical protein